MKRNLRLHVSLFFWYPCKSADAVEMRIILIVPSFPNVSETFIVSKFLGLLQSGWDVHIVARNKQASAWVHYPELRRLHIRQRVHIVWPHRPRWLAICLLPFAFCYTFLFAPRSTLGYLYRGWSQFGLDILRRFYLDSTIIRLRPDLIHFEFGTLAVGHTHYKELLNTKITVSFRGYDLNYVGLETPQYYHPVWDHADALHLLGEDLWQRAQRRGCPSSKPHMLIPPALNVTFFDPGLLKDSNYPGVLGTMARPLHILSIGRLHWKKGYDYALDAIWLLKQQGLIVQYHIVGSGPYLGALAFARHQRGLEDDVHFLGVLRQAEIKRALLWADIFLHAAVSEGFCNAVLEAQAMKLPVVCSDADGLGANVINGETGFVVARRDPDALAEKLLLLVNQSTLRQKLGQAGRERVKKIFQIQYQSRLFHEFYFKIR